MAITNNFVALKHGHIVATELSRAQLCKVNINVTVLYCFECTGIFLHAKERKGLMEIVLSGGGGGGGRLTNKEGIPQAPYYNLSFV